VRHRRNTLQGRRPIANIDSSVGTSLSLPGGRVQGFISIGLSSPLVFPQHRAGVEANVRRIMKMAMSNGTL